MKSEDIDVLRERIAQVDSEILRLVKKRLTIVEKIGRLKSDLGLPIRDHSVEAQVMRRIEERSSSLQLGDGFGRELAKLLIDASVRVQDSIIEREYKEGKSSALVIGGRGKMGSWFSRFLRSQRLHVLVNDIAGPLDGFAFEPDLEKAVTSSDIIVIATPMSVSADILSQVAEMQPSSIVFDICSLKTHLLPAVDNALKRGVSVSSVHPMFGPSTSSLVGKNLVICKCGNARAFDGAKALFADTGASIIEMDIQQHDELMAYVLGLSHAVNIGFFTTLAKSGKSFEELKRVASTTFAKQASAARDVAFENPELYYEIQSLNPHTGKVLEAFIAAMEDILSSATSGAAGRFMGIVESGREYLEGG